MLQFIRDRAQSWIAGLIVAFLILALSSIAWDAYFSPDPQVPVAKVNGKNISSAEFQRAYQQQRARIQSMIGNANINQLIPDEDAFKKRILDQLIDEELILHSAQQAGFRVSDGLLAQQIHNIGAFQANGQFSAELYNQWLTQNRVSSAEFEDLLRRDVLLQQYRLGIMSSAWTSAAEQNHLLALQKQQRDIGYLQIPVTNYLDTVDVSDEDVRAYYDANMSEFATPERVSIEYVELAVADLSKDIEVDDAALQEQYQDSQTKFGVPEERHVRHILIEVAADATEDQQAKAEEKAASLLKRLHEGEDFSKLASEASDDIGSAKNGGDLGFLARDMMMDPAFADAAFALEKGAISEPIKSAYGLHIIKLEAINSSKLKPFAEVRDQLAADYRHQRAQDHFFEQSEALANIAFENPDTLEPVKEQLGLEIKTTPLFSRDIGVAIAIDPKVREMAFSEDVLLRGNNSEPLELATDHVIILRIKDHKESSIKAFDTVSNMVKSKLKKQRAEQMAEADGAVILQALAGGKSPEELVKPSGLEWTRHLAVKRDDTAVNRQIVGEAFRIKRPEAGLLGTGGIKLNSGDYAVITVSSVIDADVAAIDEAQKQTLKQQRERFYGSSELLAVMNDLRNNAEIKKYPENF